MFYREYKFLAAHFVLSVLKTKQGVKTKNDYGTSRPPTYQWVDVYVMKKEAKWFFSEEVLYDAAKMMFLKYKDENNEVDMLNNENDKYKSEFKILPKGYLALKEWKYRRLFFGSAKGLFLTVSSLIVAASAIWGLIPLFLKLLRTIT